MCVGGGGILGLSFLGTMTQVLDFETKTLTS